MTTKKRESPRFEPRATPTASTTTTEVDRQRAGTSKSTDFDFDKHIVDAVDRGIWEALFHGDFRLAVRCDVCGRWLTASPSKKGRRGPRCAAKAGDR